MLRAALDSRKRRLILTEGIKSAPDSSTGNPPVRYYMSVASYSSDWTRINGRRETKVCALLDSGPRETRALSKCLPDRL